ncbi:MAG: hypothetical protein Q4D35_05060 [Ruminococcus sp.]|nr:hypothetical protein [Ruminococcus sp.]
MQLLFLVIKRVELVDEIMKELAKAGIKGGTCIDSMGMAKSISGMDNLPAMSVLREILKGDDPVQRGKTIFVVINDDQLEIAKNAILKVTGDLSQPNAGVLFSVPVTFAMGIN